MSNAIEISGLSKTYKGKKGQKVEALKELSLSVNQGEIFGFLGPNGAGKSTTIKILMDHIKPDTGYATILGSNVSTPQTRMRVGYLPENPAFYDYMSAEEYLAFVCSFFKMPPGIGPIEDTIKLLELWDARKRPIRSYSKGMVQRLGLAQVLVHDPDVYILDEPMSGLDPVGRALVKDIILDLKNRGKCVFFSTHILADVETVCDRVGIIMKGVLQHVEKVSTILAEGIIGYKIQYKDSKTGEALEVVVPTADLSSRMASILTEGHQIIYTEPLRKNLEDFFLRIFKNAGT